MVVSLKKNNAGRKARIGGLCFDENKMHFFAGYHTCESGKVCKVLLDVDEAREFAERVGYQKRPKLRVRVVKWLAVRYGI